MRLKLLLLAAFQLALVSCATNFYVGGEKVASFSGDMTNIEYTRWPSGKIHWHADTVDHSSATKAAGKAITNGVVASSTVVTAAATPKYFK